MKILAIGDFHGKIPKNLKQVIKKEKIDVVLSQGDFPPYDKIRKIAFKLMREDSEKKWYEVVGKKKARKWLNKELIKIKEVLKKLNSLKLPIYLVPGNVDFVGNKKSGGEYEKKDRFSKILKRYKKIKNCHNKLRGCGSFQIIGYGISSAPEIKEGTKKEKRKYRKRYKKINELFKRAEKKKKSTIFLSHNVPYKSKLDKITNKQSPKYGKHWGSIIVKDMIKKYRPVLCIAGHIHENQGKDKIGKTMAVNPGPAREGKYAIITIKDNKLEVKFKR